MATVMVIDDEIAILNMVQYMLEDEGHTVLTSPHPQEALKMISEQRPDVIICDRLMPVMSGTEVCRILYSDQELCNIPVVMMSAVNNVMSRPMPNCRHFLAKPFHFLQLINSVEDSLLIGVIR